MPAIRRRSPRVSDRNDLGNELIVALGPSYTLNPLPSDDDSLLGRVLEHPPISGQSLEEVAHPNACADKLTDAKVLPSLATFEDAEELAAGGKASATLGTFGFQGDASRATHFLYKLETEKRATRTDTSEYEACCKEKGSCGYGFVSALVYGSGEYATGEEFSGSGGVNVVSIAKAEGTARLKVLHKRTVKGWVAALIRVTDQAKAGATSISTLGDPAAIGIKLDESTLSDQVKARFENDRLSITPSPTGDLFTFSGKTGSISENEFIDRYREMFGPSDLDQLQGPKHVEQKVISATLIPISAGIVTLGIYLTVKEKNRETSQHENNQAGILPPIFLTVGGLFASAGSITWLAVATAHDSSVHRITLFDAELYVQQYNRALLRKTVRETESRIHQLSIGPTIQPRSAAMTPGVRVSPFGVAGIF